MYGSLTFLPPTISQFLMSDISFSTACKELKIAQIAQLNQLFQLLHLAHIYGHCFYYVGRMLMSQNVNNDVSNDSPIGRGTEDHRLRLSGDETVHQNLLTLTGIQKLSHRHMKLEKMKARSGRSGLTHQHETNFSTFPAQM